MSMAVSPLEIFRAKGIPNRRMEDWKYSDLRAVLDAETVAQAARLALSVSIPPQVERADIEAGRTPQWAVYGPKSGANMSAMEAAVRAFGAAGAALRVPKGAQIAEPLRLEFSGDGQARMILVLEAGAALTLLESHRPDATRMRNVAMTVILEEGSQLTHIRDAPYAPELVSVENISVVQEKHATYRARLLNAGAKLSRLEFEISLQGAKAAAEISGIGVLGDGAHCDVTTRIDHSAIDTTSSQLFKSVAGGHSRAVYQGKITVREGAVGTDSRQTAKALLLTVHAEADLKPELEILADDVKCAHGAAVGDLDADSLFYLRARGIPEAEARALLVEAFLNEVVDTFDEGRARDAADEFVKKGMARAVSTAP